MSFALAFAAMSGAAALPEGEYSGRCDYPLEAREFVQQTVFAACDRLTISVEGGRVTVIFDGSALRDGVMFLGIVEDEGIAIEEVALESGDRDDATGTCELRYSNDALSGATCFAQGRRLAYAGSIRIARD
ncbi:MAG: hypothetical protein WA985_06630 [Erythrobacter sp.]